MTAATSKGITIPFEERDILPDIVLPNSKSSLVHLAKVTEFRQVLLFCPDPRQTACRERLDSFARLHHELEPVAKVTCVTNTSPEENARFLEETPLPFQLLSDLGREVAMALDIAHNLRPVGPTEWPSSFSIVVHDINRRVLRISHDVTDPDPAPGVLAFLTSLPTREPRRLSNFAPVLHVPEVLEPSLCQSLIRSFETGQTQVSGFFRSDTGGLRQGNCIVKPDRKSRRDHALVDPALVRIVKIRLNRRVLPEIHKAFTRVVSGIEELKVVRYDASDRGRFRAHRDNVTPQTAHRRFAMTLNLNTEDYEGGALTFPEYGPDLYAPGTGDAVVFSGTLLHEATLVTKGRRYVLLAFLYDEESRQLNDEFR